MGSNDISIQGAFWSIVMGILEEHPIYIHLVSA